MNISWKYTFACYLIIDRSANSDSLSDIIYILQPATSPFLPLYYPTLALLVRRLSSSVLMSSVLIYQTQCLIVMRED
ncbi:hypothetical protein T4A_7385 [Trichinella pseudospiralis]|uniref:Uncharacterized protein n=1 Tax=Trichinella pseudospiralis TaxID=6337 RepID=A0A0V1DS47_TRIPS|nr:hypothetical protein T4A_7385 [Trichinella pseudospiralis]